MALRYETDGPVVRLTLDRPSLGNKLDADLLGELAEAWQKFDRDPGLRSAVLTGAGTSFCEGLLDGEEHLSGFPADYDIFKPIVVAVNGRCAGAGLRFVGQGDVVIAAEGAVFAGAPLTEGLPAEDLLYQRRRLALPVAELLILSGGGWTIDAERAYSCGWIQEVVPGNKLLARAHEIALAIARQDPVAVQMAKEVLVRGRDLFTYDAVEQGRALPLPLAENRAVKAALLK